MERSEDQTMMANGFEEAIIGLDTSGEVFRVVYDIDTIISILMERDEMTEEDALEHFSYNIQGSYVGEGTPLYVYGGGQERVLELMSNFQVMTKDETMMSLYDYRGHKDTKGEGQGVYAKAKERGVTVQSRDVDHERYKGKVMMYPKWFLDEYFQPTIELKAKEYEDDDLPF